MHLMNPLRAALIAALAGLAPVVALAELSGPTPKYIHGGLDAWPSDVPFPADSRWGVLNTISEGVLNPLKDETKDEVKSDPVLNDDQKVTEAPSTNTAPAAPPVVAPISPPASASAELQDEKYHWWQYFPGEVRMLPFRLEYGEGGHLYARIKDDNVYFCTVDNIKNQGSRFYRDVGKFCDEGANRKTIYDDMSETRATLNLVAEGGARGHGSPYHPPNGAADFMYLFSNPYYADNETQDILNGCSRYAAMPIYKRKISLNEFAELRYTGLSIDSKIQEVKETGYKGPFTTHTEGEGERPLDWQVAIWSDCDHSATPENYMHDPSILHSPLKP